MFASKRTPREASTPHTCSATNPLDRAPSTSTSVVEKEHPIPRVRQHPRDHFEDGKIGLHPAELEREEAEIELTEEGPPVELIGPVHDVGVAQASDGDLILHLGEQVRRTVERTDGPLSEEIEESLGCDGQTPFDDDSGRELIRRAFAALEPLNPPALQPSPQGLFCGVGSQRALEERLPLRTG